MIRLSFFKNVFTVKSREDCDKFQTLKKGEVKPPELGHTKPVFSLPINLRPAQRRCFVAGCENKLSLTFLFMFFLFNGNLATSEDSSQIQTSPEEDGWGEWLQI